jgi:hypothetical protein
VTTTAIIAKLRAEVGEVIAQHRDAKDIRAFATYADDPAGFMRDVLRCEPWSKQVEMAERIRDHSRSVIVTCNGLGKDWVTARIALWWVYARRGFVILTGPTERQVKQILMREIRRAFAIAPELPGELYALELRVDEGGECGILAFTSDNADRLTGFHHPRLLICVTEGQGVDDEAYEAALSCATGPENRIFVYGNPTRPAGRFYQAAHSEHWSALTIAATEHPNVVTGRNEIPGAVSREWIATMRDEYGEGSSIYKARVLAQFPEESIEGLIKREWLRAAFARHDAHVAAVANTPAPPPLLSLDIARFGPDSSCLCISRGPVVQELITWRGASVTDSADRLIANADRFVNTRSLSTSQLRYSNAPLVRRPVIVIDEPGLGGGCIDIVRKAGWLVEAFNGGAAASDSRRFLNRRAESHWKFRELLENNVIALPRDPALEEEAMAIEWQLTAAGQIQIVSKDAVRQTLGRSPDRLDAVVMAMWETYEPRPVWGISKFTF